MKTAIWTCLAVALTAVLSVGCADSGDDPCDPDTGEECEDGREEVREVPRGGGFLPYKPGLPSVEVSEQALKYPLPNFVWHTGQPMPNNLDWPGQSGGGIIWRHIGGGEYMQEMPLFRYARQIPPGHTCSTFTSGYVSVVCKRPAGGTSVYTCPFGVRVNSPNAYSADRLSLKYDYSTRYTTVSTPTLEPSRLVVTPPSSPTGYTLLSCHYPAFGTKIKVTAKNVGY